MKMGLRDLIELIEVKRTFDKPQKSFRGRRNKESNAFEMFTEFYENYEKFQKFLKDKEKKEDKKKAWHEEITVAHYATLFFGTAPLWGPMYFSYMKHLGFW